MGTLIATPARIDRFPDDTQRDKLPEWPLIIQSEPPTTGIAAAYVCDGGWLSGDPSFDSGVPGTVKSVKLLGATHPGVVGIRATCLRGSIRFTKPGFDPLIVPVVLMV